MVTNADGRPPSIFWWLVPTLAFAGLVCGAWLVVPRGTRADWLTYVRGAELIWAGQSPYASFQLAGPYLLPAAAEGNGYVYPPSAPVLTSVLLEPFELWVAVLLVTLVAGMLAVLWCHRLFRPLPATAVIVVIAITPATWDGISSGAMSPLLAGMLGLAYAGSPLTGLGSSLKAHPAAWITLSLTRTHLAWAAVGFAIPAVASVLLAGPSVWGDYVTTVLNARPDCQAFLPSLQCLGAPTWIAGVVGTGFVVGGMVAGRTWLLLALGALPIILGPQVALHYLVGIGPGLVALACVLWRGAPSRVMTPASGRRPAASEG